MLRPLHASFHVVWFTSLFLSWRYLLRHAVLCFNLAHGGIFFASWLFTHRDGMLFFARGASSSLLFASAAARGGIFLRSRLMLVVVSHCKDVYV